MLLASFTMLYSLYKHSTQMFIIAKMKFSINHAHLKRILNCSTHEFQMMRSCRTVLRRVTPRFKIHVNPFPSLQISIFFTSIFTRSTMFRHLLFTRPISFLAVYRTWVWSVDYHQTNPQTRVQDSETRYQHLQYRPGRITLVGVLPAAIQWLPCSLLMDSSPLHPEAG